MGSRVSIRDQLEAGYEAWKAVARKVMEKNPEFLAMYGKFDDALGRVPTNKEAVLLELDRLYEIDKRNL